MDLDPAVLQSILDAVLSAQNQAYVLQGLMLLSVVLPVVQKIAVATSNKVDDKIVGAISDALGTVLAFVPRVRFGKGVGQPTLAKLPKGVIE